MGALSITGVTEIKTPFEPLVAGPSRCPTPTSTGPRTSPATSRPSVDWAADWHRAGNRDGRARDGGRVFLEPVQNAGGCFPPPPGYFAAGPGDLRPLRRAHGVRRGDLRLRPAGPLFGCDRYGYVPDMITMAKGLTSGYSPLGAVIVSDFLVEPFLARRCSFLHGVTFGGHPVSCAVAMANLDLSRRRTCCGNVRQPRSRLQGAPAGPPRPADRGGRAGGGLLLGIELVKEQDGAETFDDEEVGRLLRGFLGRRSTTPA